MSNRVTIEMDADEAKFVAKMLAAAKGPKQLKEEAAKAVKESKALERAAKRVYDETRTPAEQHNRRMQELNALLKRGKIDQETYNRAVKQAGTANREAFGPTALTNVKNYVAGLVAGVASLETIKRLMLEAKQIAADAGQRIVDDASTRDAFRQVSSGNQNKFDRLLSERDRLRGTQGMEPAEAGRLVFAAASAGDQYLDDLDTFASLKKIAFDTSAGVTSVQKLQSAFGGEGAGRTGAGSTRQILNKILAGAGPSPVMADQIASAMAGTTVPFSQIGGQDEELIALMGVMSEVTGTPKDAASQIKSLSDQLIKKRRLIKGGTNLTGLDFIKALPGMASEGRLLNESGTAVDLNKFLGEANAISAMEMIGKMDSKISSRLVDVQAAERTTGTDRDLLAGAISLDDPTGDTAEFVKNSEQFLEVTDEKTLADWSNIYQSLNNIKKANDQRRLGLAGRVFNTMIDSSSVFTSSNKGGAEYLSNILSDGAMEGAPAEQLAELKRIRAAMERLSQKPQMSHARDSE